MSYERWFDVDSVFVLSVGYRKMPLCHFIFYFSIIDIFKVANILYAYISISRWTLIYAFLQGWFEYTSYDIPRVIWYLIQCLYQYKNNRFMIQIFWFWYQIIPFVLSKKMHTSFYSQTKKLQASEFLKWGSGTYGKSGSHPKVDIFTTEIILLTFFTSENNTWNMPVIASIYSCILFICKE